MGWRWGGQELWPALSAIGMHARLVCQLLANGRLTAATSYIAAVNTPWRGGTQGTRNPHMNHHGRKRSLRSVKNEGDRWTLVLISPCSHSISKILCNNVKARRSWLFIKNIKKTWQITGCTPLAYTALSTFGCKCHGEGLSHFHCHCSERIFCFVCTNLLWAKTSRSSTLQMQSGRH